MNTSNRRTVVATLLSVVLFTTVATVPVVQAGGAANPGPQSPAETSDVTKIRGCQAITEPGRYVLVNDIENGDRGENFTFISEACIRIESSDVTFDGNGHVVDGFGVSDTTAIRAGGDRRVSNVSVENVRIAEWNRAIYYRNVAGGVVQDADVSGNSFGVFVEDSTDVTVRNVAASKYFVGIYLSDTDVTLTDNTLTGNQTNAVVRE